jgi:deoxyuridine 5'-triphosphate nucleotidohydrolase
VDVNDVTDGPWPTLPEEVLQGMAGGQVMTQGEVLAMRHGRGPRASFGAGSGGTQDYSRDVLVAKRTDGQDGPPFTPPAYAGDCGLDLALSHDVEVEQGGTVNAPCGVAVALPAGTFGYITGRSSTWIRHGLLVVPGVIDEGWRGELYTVLYRPLQVGPEKLHLPAGTRLAQLILLPNLLEGLQVHFVKPDTALPVSERGISGFGSSGT